MNRYALRKLEEVARRARVVAGFVRLQGARLAVDRLRGRMWDLRHHLSGYDATCVALAEALGATSLLTADRRLAEAPGVRCPIDVL